MNHEHQWRIVSASAGKPSHVSGYPLFVIIRMACFSPWCEAYKVVQIDAEELERKAKCEPRVDHAS